MIYGRAGIDQAYQTGRGSIIMRARTEVEKVARQRRSRADRRHRDPVSGEQGAAPRQDRRADARQAHRGHQRSARRERSRRHAPGHRAEEGRLPAGRAEPALSADRPADVVRHHQPLDRRRPPGGARPQGDARASSSSTGATSSAAARASSSAEAEGQREIVEGLGMAITEVDLVIKTIRESRDPDEAQGRA